MTRILISAGEASGDLHAGAVTRALKQIEPEVQVFGMGGDCLRAAGGEVIYDIKDHGVMGFVEVLRKLPDLWKLRNSFIQLMERRRPDVLLTIDASGETGQRQRHQGGILYCAFGLGLASQPGGRRGESCR